MKLGRKLRDDVRNGAVSEAICFSVTEQDLNNSPTVPEAIYGACANRDIKLTCDARRFFTGGELIQEAGKLKNNQVPVVISHRMPEAHVLELGLSVKPAIPFLHVQLDDKGNADWVTFVDNSQLPEDKTATLWNREHQMMATG